MANGEVLIVGAGPTGLVLALWLQRLGVRPRIIDKTAAPGTTSRAMAVQGRTLELYDQIGLAEDAIARGRKMDEANLRVHGVRVAAVEFGDFGAGLSPFPFVLILPQDEHERLLVEKLRDAGIEVERETELVHFTDDKSRVRVRLRKADGSMETRDVAYLCGCDGARSITRERLGIGFPGGTYGQLFFVADADAVGPTADGGVHICLERDDLCLVFPMKNTGNTRLIGIVRSKKKQEDVVYADVADMVEAYTGLKILDVNWFSTYRVHHRVAAKFRINRIFLLGDAAHVHSPAGAQGMNTGIGDAINLAWKLSSVIRDDADPALLDTYETERIGFARRLVRTTDSFFTAMTNPSWFGHLLRLDIVPAVVPVLMRIEAFRRFAFRTLSQLIVRYPGSAISAGRAGDVAGGDRLPWVKLDDGTDNFAPLRALAWQVHVYGGPPPSLLKWCKARGVPLHVFPWNGLAAARGLAQDALYLVRPDGYVAFADKNADPAGLEAFLIKRGVAPTRH